jgi:hypothetical protein
MLTSHTIFVFPRNSHWEDLLTCPWIDRAGQIQFSRLSQRMQHIGNVEITVIQFVTAMVPYLFPFANALGGVCFAGRNACLRRKITPQHTLDFDLSEKGT